MKKREENEKGKKIKKSKGILIDYEARMNLSGKAEKRWFWTAFLLLNLYVEIVIFAQNTVLNYISFSLLNVLQAMAAIPLCFIGLLIIRKWKITGEDILAKARVNLRRQLLFAVLVWVLTFFLFFLYHRAFWPGAFTEDSISQYGQAYSGSYNNWHPVLHTWLFFYFPFQIFHGPAGIVLTQILWFSFSVTYLFYVLYTSGCPKAFLACGWLYVVGNPNTLSIMILPWKDSAFTIFSAVVFAQLVRIYLTNGIWLKKWYNLAAFSVFVFLTLEMRHNAILLVAPIFVLLTCIFKCVKKKILLSILIVFAGHILLYGPIFSIMHVELPDERHVETMGLPMTILSDIYVQNQEALSDDARSFMDSLATPEVWEVYSLGNFNSIKWQAGTDLSHIEEVGYKRVLQYTVGAAMERPDLAWRAFCLLTSLVWEVEIEGGWSIYPYLVDNSYGIYYQGNIRLLDGFRTYASLVSAHLTKYLFCYTGGTILVLLFLAVGNLGGGNLCRSCLVLSPMAYNFGTMLLLTGPDFRFFHFNFVIIIPLIYLLLRREGNSR